MSNKPYRTIFREAVHEIELKRSRFIGYAFPVHDEDEAQAAIEYVKELNKQATHNCSAYITGPNGVHQRYSDDGEPQGTAGMPMLEVLRKEGLTDVCVVVTRYFGGIKLGAAGLVRAYSGSCKDAVSAAHIVERTPYREVTVSIDYSSLGKVDYLLRDGPVVSLGREFAEDVSLRLAAKEDYVPELERKLADATDGSAGVALGGTAFLAVEDGRVLDALEEIEWTETN